jgi:hypothetical protein
MWLINIKIKKIQTHFRKQAPLFDILSRFLQNYVSADKELVLQEY